MAQYRSRGVGDIRHPQECSQLSNVEIVTWMLHGQTAWVLTVSLSIRRIHHVTECEGWPWLSPTGPVPPLATYQSQQQLKLFQHRLAGKPDQSLHTVDLSTELYDRPSDSVSP